MTALTHAVFDAPGGYVQVGPGHPNAAIALAEAAKLGGPARGYVVGPIEGLPGHRVIPTAPNPAVPEPEAPQPEAPRAAVVQDPEGPGLFD